MFVIIGYILVLGSILGGYIGGGGHVGVLFQRFEFVIIIGGALGGFRSGANSMHVVKPPQPSHRHVKSLQIQ